VAYRTAFTGHFGSYLRAFTLAALSYLALHGHHVEPVHHYTNERRTLAPVTR